MTSLGKPADLLVVGVCTYLRPKMLSVLLEACGKLEPAPGLRLALLIVDNDARGSARAAVEGARPKLAMPVHYAIEPARGIANARNRVLTEALALDAAYLALIDDDEVMKPDWLLALHSVMRETGADAVGAEVHWDLPEDAPAWAHALPTSPKFETLYGRRQKKKKPRVTPSTNNVLMKARIFRELGVRFDARYGLAAGEDLDFFIRARQAGAVYAFSPGATVLEHVPRSRLTLRWRFARWINFSSVNVKMHQLQYGRASAWRRYFFRSLPGFIAGPAILLTAPLFGPETLLRGLKRLGGSIGMLKGLFGQVADEYRTVHGG